MDKSKMRIKISTDGPYVVTGNVPLYEYTITYDDEGYSRDYKLTKKFDVRETYSLCRCGASKNKPFCDGMHSIIGFSGKETASRKPYIKNAETLEGPKANLTDYPDLCAYARFCDSYGGVWDLTQKTDDEESYKEFIRQCQHCPSGRLVAWDKQMGKPIEEELEPSIALIQDPQLDCSGPIWVRGGIVIESADGEEYEVRNRVTLCRCGKSTNKPFCDGAHAAIKFKDYEN